uniref:Sel1 repeat family protein n=1 Tax=Acidithiobacillus sulfuriphilus TaxID=1867749 RepID=A0A3M8QZC2_9PROT|nr:sel1 repeat family protein [Acidithiobacillus sulfuriphilus]
MVHDFKLLAIESGFINKIEALEPKTLDSLVEILLALSDEMSLDQGCVQTLFSRDCTEIGAFDIYYNTLKHYEMLFNLMTADEMRLALTHIKLTFILFNDSEEHADSGSLSYFEMFCKIAINKNSPELLDIIIQEMYYHDIDRTRYAQLLMELYQTSKSTIRNNDVFKSVISESFYLADEIGQFFSIAGEEDELNDKCISSCISCLPSRTLTCNEENIIGEPCKSRIDFLTRFFSIFKEDKNIAIRALLALCEGKLVDAYELIDSVFGTYGDWNQDSHYKTEVIYIDCALSCAKIISDPEKISDIYDKLSKNSDIDTFLFEHYAYDYFAFLAKSGHALPRCIDLIHPDIEIVYGERAWADHNVSLAYHYFKNAFEQRKYPFLYYYMARFHDLKLIKNFDADSALEFYRKAAQGGHTPAMNRLGYIYRENKEYEKSFLWFKKASDLGRKDSFCEVGKCFYCGLGVLEDKVVATRYGYSQIVGDQR